MAHNNNRTASERTIQRVFQRQSWNDTAVWDCEPATAVGLIESDKVIRSGKHR